jgi:hypothetical protein
MLKHKSHSNLNLANRNSRKEIGKENKKKAFPRFYGLKPAGPVIQSHHSSPTAHTHTSTFGSHSQSLSSHAPTVPPRWSASPCDPRACMGSFPLLLSLFSWPQARHSCCVVADFQLGDGGAGEGIARPSVHLHRTRELATERETTGSSRPRRRAPFIATVDLRIRWRCCLGGSSR